MNIKDFKDGLEILIKYYDNQEGFHLGAEHDIFYMYPTDNPVSDSDVELLRNLGWHQEDCEYDGDGKFIYDVDNAWGAFV
jgi:hypothetical protein